MLVDKFGRRINYLRLAVTDRCNLRCFYCMPEQGLDWLSRKELMSYEEMLHISSVLVKAGIEKVRITGGEPFVRKGFMSFLTDLSKLNGLQQLTLTTNGVLTAPFVPDLKRIGVTSVNLSLDTLDRDRFFAITRRDELPRVMEALEALLQYGIEVKINAVVMEGKNTDDILPLVELTKDMPVSVRFIEEMPFNGGGAHHTKLAWDHVQIMHTIKDKYPGIHKLPDPPYSTSYNYQVPGHKGSVGVIAAYTRSFCGSCNRIRLTPQGELKTCLYGNAVVNVKDLMRAGSDEQELVTALQSAISQKERDGWEAEKSVSNLTVLNASMATIGG
ncbi:GTP 3',8-cyclase MoaA [Pontibacter korlensis]|uniref:GTP 3',8-cyclase n=1 Tax=Pontibacter korlensis TaxID=400092 RepID=A0A0E3UZ64_9BACT|nr:GTP 3',8-cyclase MoaA [Pontibacter korlensis]AKD05752.1 molybdenum cofactor biosynthesis protein MoaA [Pontibacter korlensis]